MLLTKSQNVLNLSFALTAQAFKEFLILDCIAENLLTEGMDITSPNCINQILLPVEQNAGSKRHNSLQQIEGKI